MTPEDMQTLVLYRDALMLVINKPHGINVHKGPKGGESLEDYFDALRFGLPRPPFLAHRLDRDTSGCLILGRNNHGLKTLGRMFEQGKIDKTYWAVVEGTLKEKQGVINAPLLKIKKPKGWSMQVAKNGQPSVTEYKVMAEFDGATWLELTPKTGRTHQLRVHCRYIGHPILGDWLYNDSHSRGDFPLLHLHAQRIVIPSFDQKKEPVDITAPPPAHMLPYVTV